MIIHIVKAGETIQSIADEYEVLADRIILDNGLTNKKLITGQSLVILQPVVTYTTKENDTLESIVTQFQITPVQLLRNNRFLLEKNIQPGQMLVISYSNNEGMIDTFGYVYPFVAKEELEQVLPYLTYLCVYGTMITKQAELTALEEHSLVNHAKAWKVSPILMVPLLIQRDLKYSDDTYLLLTNDSNSDKLITNIINMIKQHGYHGVAVLIEYLNSFNLEIYEKFIKKLYLKLKENALKLFVTISPNNITLCADDIKHIQADIDEFMDGIIIMYNNVSIELNTSPQPVTSINGLNGFVNAATAILDVRKICIGCPVIGVDWELPYIPDSSQISILKYDNTLTLAETTNSEFKLDETSQSPCFKYRMAGITNYNEHIVWFVDASTINALADLIPLYELNGTGHWNVMYYFAPLWSIINARFEINKISNIESETATSIE